MIMTLMRHTTILLPSRVFIGWRGSHCCLLLAQISLHQPRHCCDDISSMPAEVSRLRSCMLMAILDFWSMLTLSPRQIFSYCLPGYFAALLDCTLISYLQFPRLFRDIATAIGAAATMMRISFKLLTHFFWLQFCRRYAPPPHSKL